MSLLFHTLDHHWVSDLSQDDFPAIVQTWQNHSLSLTATGTHFGFVYDGHPILERFGGQEAYPLHPGMYFCLPSDGVLRGQDSSGIVITRLGHRATFSLGGPLEPTGRFAYINGGTDSLLIPPVLCGDPCLNALYLPPGVDQTPHTHPSYRVGLVVNGSGDCETPEGTLVMAPRTLFVLPAHHLHKFRTYDQRLTLVVFHPDSEVGFTHRNNPMLQRTLIEGISAAQLPHLQTAIPEAPSEASF